MNEVGIAVGDTLCCGKYDREAVKTFIKLIEILDSTAMKFQKPKELIRGICYALEKFVLDEKFSLEYIKLFFSKLTKQEGKKQ